MFSANCKLLVSLYDIFVMLARVSYHVPDLCYSFVMLQLYLVIFFPAEI